MTAIDASNVVDEALRAVLAPLAPGGAHNTLRDQRSAFPVIVFRLAPGSEDLPRYGARDGVEHLEYDVRVIAPRDLQAGVGAILANVHATLQGVAMTLPGLTHLQTMRRRRIPTYSESTTGTAYIHRGSTYTVSISHPT